MFDTKPTQTTDAEEPKSDNLKKFVFALTALLLLVTAARFYFVQRARKADQAVKTDEGPSHNLTTDDYIVPRKIYPSSMADVRALDGKRIWAFASGQMTYYPATASRIDYAHGTGFLMGAEPMDVTGFIEQAAPASLYSRIPHGDKQVVLLFHKPSEAGKLFGTPVGYKENGQYTFYLDEAYFYDDPHVTYKHWPANVWQAIDAHKPALGMNELQAQLALGQVSKPGSGTTNNRSVVYDNNSHPVTITFEHGHATKIE